MTEAAARDATAPGRETRQETRSRLPPEARMPQILDAAIEEFAERGYAGARMAAVASRAGIAKGLIYHYFPSKAELFQASIAACARPIFEDAERRLSGFQGSARQLLADLIGLAYARIREEQRERALFRLILTEAERVPALAEFYRREILERALGIAQAVLRAGIASGEFRPSAAALPGLAAVIMAPAVAGSVWQMILGDAAADLAAMQAAHLDLLLAGLGAGGATG
ncbi:MAG: TetR/AcrR family transcriptional regulator [Paracraurococcus sp.]